MEEYLRILTDKLNKEYIPKSKIREKIDYYKRYGKHITNNGLIGENRSEWEEYVMQEEIDILKELLGEEKC